MTLLTLASVFLALAAGWWQAPSVPLAPPVFVPALVRPLSTARVGTAAAVVAAGVAMRYRPLIVSLTIVLVIGALALRRRRREGMRRAEAITALPESLELCIVTLGAGGTVTDCLRTLQTTGSEPARSVAAEALGLMTDGALLDGALLDLQRRLGPAYQPLSGALRLAAEQGGSIGALLDRLAIEARAERRRAGELRARRLSVLLLVPLVTFSLPAVLVGVVVPLAVVALRHVS